MTTNHLLAVAANSLVLPPGFQYLPDSMKSGAHSARNSPQEWQKLKKNLADLHNPFSRLLLLLLLIWFAAPQWLPLLDGTATGVDQSIWLLITLSLISFLLLLCATLWIFQFCWERLGLPGRHQFIYLFKTLNPWQQLSLYWASFALLLFTASICLIAIC